MLKNTNIPVLATIGSSGFALAFLGAISTLWTDTPTEAGLQSFAFALAIAFATVLGNITVLGAHIIIDKRRPGKTLELLTSGLAILVFLVGLFTSAILFSEGLNSWFTKAPIMSPSLIVFARLIVFVPVLWLCIAGLLVIFPKKKSP